jgi:activator of HSP90 ATPase
LSPAQRVQIKEEQSSNMSTAIHQEIDFETNPQRVYEALLDARQFSAFTGLPAEIEPKAGGAFSCFGGIITGRTVELVPNKRIVQAWRVKIWPEGVYSIVSFALEPKGSGTRLILTHDGFPEPMRAHLNGEMPEGGWHRQYWQPLKNYLGR